MVKAESWDQQFDWEDVEEEYVSWNDPTEIVGTIGAAQVVVLENGNTAIRRSFGSFG